MVGSDFSQYADLVFSDEEDTLQSTVVGSSSTTNSLRIFSEALKESEVFSPPPLKSAVARLPPRLFVDSLHGNANVSPVKFKIHYDGGSPASPLKSRGFSAKKIFQDTMESSQFSTHSQLINM